MQRITRTVIAAVFAVLVSVSAFAAPEGRSESRDWLTRTIDRVVVQIVKLLAPHPTDDPNIIPPKP